MIFRLSEISRNKKVLKLTFCFDSIKLIIMKMVNRISEIQRIIPGSLSIFVQTAMLDKIMNKITYFSFIQLNCE